MPASVAALRVLQLTDPSGQLLPAPRPLDPATDTIPYGVRLRLEADLEGPQAVYPLQARVLWGDWGVRAPLYRTAPGGSTYGGQFRLPLDLPSGALEEITAPPRFPLPEWGGPLPLGGGEYELRLAPIPLGTIPSWPYGDPPVDPDTPESVWQLQVAAPTLAGGTPPTLVSLSRPPGEGLRLGEPWRLEAQVQKTQYDVLGVFFCSMRPGMGEWYTLRDDGTKGDRVAGDGIHSLLRVGGDYYDVPENWPADPVPVTLLAQAVDVCGNWSAPLTIGYDLRYDLPPVWYESPSPEAPHVLQGGADRDQGPIDLPKVWAQVDRSGAWVCGRLVTVGKEAMVLYPEAAGGTDYAALQPSDRRHLGREIVLYAVAPEAPTTPGKRVAVGIPPLVPAE